MRRLDIVVLGLSISSSWGNGHATTWRALIKGLATLGHSVTFLERDVPWYSGENRDLVDPDFCRLAFYAQPADLSARHAAEIRAADIVIIGSYVPDGVAVIDAVMSLATGNVAFYDIDTPVTLAKLARGEEDYLAARQIPLFDVYFSFTGGPTLPRLEREFGASHARALYCAVEETVYRPTGEPLTWDLGYLGTYSPDRQPALERLLLEPARRLPDRRFVVAGPLYPATIDWPANVTRIDHLAPRDHASFYSRQRWTLNITRADMLAAGWSPSVRLFEAAACGTPILSDGWPGLAELFPENEAILLPGNSEGVVALLAGRNKEAGRLALALEARRRVLQRHTGRARAVELVAAFDEIRTQYLERTG
jgi:spore maturation protein CgeB